MGRLDQVRGWLSRPRLPYQCQPLTPHDQQDNLLPSALPSHRRRYFFTPNTSLIVCAVLFLVSFIFGCIMWFGDTYDNSVLKLVAIRNDLDVVYDLWRMPPSRPILSVYIFNYTNTERMMKGYESPKVKELGPYVFRERTERVNVVFHDNGTVSFQENKTIVFSPELSSGSLSDIVYIPNLPLFTLESKIKKLDYATQHMLFGFVKMFNVGPIQNVTVHDFIWGYDDPLYSAIRKLQSMFKGEEEQKFGFLAKRRGLHHDIITVKTGFPDLNSVGEIQVFDGADRIGAWGASRCDDLRGSEGGQFPGNLVREKKDLYIYAHAMCRRLLIKYNKTSQSVDGFPVNVYNIPDNTFIYSPYNFENSCYRFDGDYPPNGVFFSGRCATDSPVYSSFPHFWMGSPELQSSIQGLKPDRNLHHSSFQLHERLGITLRALTRFQLNIKVEKAKYINLITGIKDGTILPLAWQQYDSGPLPEHFVNIVYHLTYTVRIVQTVLKWLTLLSTIGLAVLAYKIIYY